MEKLLTNFLSIALSLFVGAVYGAKPMPYIDLIITNGHLGDNFVSTYPIIEAARRYCLKNGCEVRLWGSPGALALFRGTPPKGLLLKEMDIVSEADKPVPKTVRKREPIVELLRDKNFNLSDSRGVYVLPGNAQRVTTDAVAHLVDRSKLDTPYYHFSELGPKGAEDTVYTLTEKSLKLSAEFHELYGGVPSNTELTELRRTLLMAGQKQNSLQQVDENLKLLFPSRAEKPYILINFTTSKEGTDLIGDGKARQIIQEVEKRYGGFANIVIANFDNAKVRPMQGGGAEYTGKYKDAQEFKQWLTNYMKDKPNIGILGKDDLSSGLVMGMIEHPKRAAVITADTGLGHIAAGLNESSTFVISTNQFGSPSLDGKQKFELWKAGKNNYYTEVGHHSSPEAFEREVLRPLFRDVHNAHGSPSALYDSWMRNKLKALLCL